MSVIVLSGAALMVLGVFLPWITEGSSYSGFTDPRLSRSMSGLELGAAGFIGAMAAAAGRFAIVNRKRGARARLAVLAAIFPGAMAVVICLGAIILVIQINGSSEDVVGRPNHAWVGVGLVATLVGGIVTVIGGMLAITSARHPGE